jgi:hypothetical protein
MINLKRKVMKTTLKILAIILASQLQVWAQTAPIASNVAILGEALYNSGATTKGTYTTGTVLTGAYDFSDADLDLEGTSTYIWYRDGSAITGATSIRYTVQAADVSKTITFEVTPVDDTPQTGSALVSTGLVANTTTLDNVGTNNLTYSSGTNSVLSTVLDNQKTLTVDGASTVLTIHGDLDGTNGINIVVSNGAQLIVNGQFITDNNVDINVDASSSFIIESGLVAKNNSVLVISGTMTINADVLVENNATFNVGTDGLLAVSGDVGFGSKGELTVDGLMTIGGDLTGAATLDGSGTVTVGGTIAPSITDSNSVLPIELTYFKAYHTNNKVSFKWETASELNNDFFTIERSEDGVNFYGIETIGGAGNSLSSIVYSANDENPINGINYYRLKQTDYNGDYSYSELQAVEISRFSTKEINELVIYPNPIVSSNHLLSIDIKGEYHNESARIKIFGMNGQEIIEYEVPLDGNFNKTAIYISILTTGNYIVMVLTSSNSFKNKLVVL